MSNLTAELLGDPELLRIAEQAHSEVLAEAVAQDRRYTREEIADRIAELCDWRKRALRAEAQVQRPPV